MRKFLVHAAVYHSLLIALLVAFKLLIDFRASSEWLVWLVYFARLMIFLCLGAFLFRSDLLLLNWSAFAERHGFQLQKVDGKFIHWLKAFAFMIFTLSWPLLLLLYRGQMPFLASAYLSLVGLAVSAGYLEYLTCSYDDYVHLKNHRRWGLQSKLP